MNKNTLIKLYKRFGKELLGVNIKIKLDEEYYFQHRDNIVGVMKKLPNDEMEGYVQNYFNSKNINLNPYTIYYLHELGHMNHKITHKLNKEYYDRQHMEVEALDVATQALSLTFEKSLEMYYEIESEKIANEFIDYAIREKREIVEKFDKVIEQLYA